MNIEFEVKNILRDGRSFEEKSIMISQITTFNEDLVLKALQKGGEKASDIYANILKLHKQNV